MAHLKGCDSEVVTRAAKRSSIRLRSRCAEGRAICGLEWSCCAMSKEEDEGRMGFLLDLNNARAETMT